jgi:hypothetical protein
MAEPRRWLVDRSIDAELRSVLEAAREPPALPPELHAELTRYAAGLAAQGALAKVAGAGLGHRLLLTFGSSKVLALVSLIGAAAAASFGVLYVLVPSPHAAQSTPSRAVSSASKPAPSHQLVPAMPTTPMLEPPEPPVRPRVSPRDVPPGDVGKELAPPAAASASSGVFGIADEARLLERARSVLADAPQLALDLTEQHRQLGPSAQLSAEREFIAIEALLRLGRRAEAERRAAPLLSQAPNSVYTRRLRSLFSHSAPPIIKSTNP